MKLRKICVIVNAYPSEQRVANAFVETLVNEMENQGVECCVIAPQSVSKYLKGVKPEKTERYRYTSKGKRVKVYSPRYITASVYKMGPINTAYITLASFQHTVKRCFEKILKSEHEQFDAVYGHFIFPAGITACAIGKEYGIPSFFAYGENTTYTIDYFGARETKKRLEEICGVVSVSSENKRVLIANDIVEENKIGVFPNSINNEDFYPRDKKTLRNKYKIPQDAFIVAFVGRFLNVKGPDRLSAALDGLNNDSICSFFIGMGSLKPTCRNILFMGTLPHDRIGEYLSMADVFVLPTLAEGCCNAIIEAMACGLPVISSNLPFNDDILDETNSIRIDPNDIEAIKSAINTLFADKELREKLAQGALETASKLKIENRTKNIIAFIEEKIEDSK